MNEVSERLAKLKFRIVRFEFPYMHARRDGKRKPPDREPVLRRTWIEVIEQLGGGGDVIIGGKSMGGRMASLVADEVGARGLLCFGFPFHAPGKPPGSRIAHLAGIKAPTLIVQGTRDAFGTASEVSQYDLAPSVRVAWIEDGDHSLVPRAKSGRSKEQNLDAAVAAAADFSRQPLEITPKPYHP